VLNESEIIERMEDLGIDSADDCHPRFYEPQFARVSFEHAVCFVGRQTHAHIRKDSLCHA
jgi:hypothetical protein